MIDPIGLPAVSATPGRPEADDPLWRAAQALEQNFLSEMLKSSGFDRTSGSFGGGVGEDQFASYLREARASDMVEAGGIGLAEQLFNAFRRQTDDV